MIAILDPNADCLKRRVCEENLGHYLAKTKIVVSKLCGEEMYFETVAHEQEGRNLLVEMVYQV